MENNEIVYESLRKAVEMTIGRNMHTPRDFDYLSMCIYDRTKDTISAMTLKRFWGYLGKKNIRQPRLDTLNILSQLIGYTDWESFLHHSSQNNLIESDFILNNQMYTNSLKVGTEIRIKWNPNRSILIRYEGHELFTILESINSKLCKKDTFHCGQFIENEPLFLSCLIHKGSAPCNYVCGKENGIKYLITKQ